MDKISPELEHILKLEEKYKQECKEAGCLGCPDCKAIGWKMTENKKLSMQDIKNTWENMTGKSIDEEDPCLLVNKKTLDDCGLKMTENKTTKVVQEKTVTLNLYQDKITKLEQALGGG